MLHHIKELYGNTLAASDGAIGHVKDFYFDDQTWVIRYLVAETGTWLPGRLVLLSPHAFGQWDEVGKTLPIKLHKQQIQDSPSIESHRPVSRQYEEEYYLYYGWPAYWDGGAMGGIAGFPVATSVSTPEKLLHHSQNQQDDIHLRSCRSVTGYHIQATDGAIGSVSGFQLDVKSWTIRELVVEAGPWYSGKEILISPAKIARISYEQSSVFVNLTQADIRHTAENHVAKIGTGSR